jgi:hypothetical protein
MFDPLHKWLGIPPDQQPPDHYRLLGITRFESDTDVIHAAADKQLSFLHDFANGPQAAAAEELSNQISAARVTLVNPRKKAAYDLQLKSTLTAPPPTPPPTPPPVPQSPLVVVSDSRRPARHFRWQSVVGHVVSTVVFFILPAYLLYRHPRIKQIANRAMGREEIPKSVTVVREPAPVRQHPVVHEHRTVRPTEAYEPPVLGRSESSFFVGREDEETEAEQESISETVESPAEKLIHLKLDLNSTKWIMPLEDSFESGQYFVTTVADCPGTIELQPSSGELSTDRATRLAFDGASGLAIDLRLAVVGNPPALSVTGEWVCQMDRQSEADFSLKRLRNYEKYLAKQRTAAGTIQSFLNERNQLKLFIDSRGLKRLEAVNTAENRIKFIDSQMGALKRQAQHEQQFVEQFVAFKQRVNQIQDRSELVVRNVDQD